MRLAEDACAAAFPVHVRQSRSLSADFPNVSATKAPRIPIGKGAYVVVPLAVWSQAFGNTFSFLFVSPTSCSSICVGGWGLDFDYDRRVIARVMPSSRPAEDAGFFSRGESARLRRK